MPLLLHVHDAPGLSPQEVLEAHLRDGAIGRPRGVDLRRYWYDRQAGKLFCLVEAPSPEAAQAVHDEGTGLRLEAVYRVEEGSRDRKDYDAMRILFAAVLAPDSNCIDVGCHQGVLLREMLRCAPGGSHIAFEPIPELAAALAARHPEVHVRQTALASRSGTTEFVHLRDRPGYSHLLGTGEQVAAHEAEVLTVPLATLDEVLADGYVPALVKIDVEGAELDVLKGAQRTLATHRPVVVFEHGAGRPDASGELFDLLKDAGGLRLYDIDGNGPMGRQRFLDVLGELQVWNWVARP